MSSATVRWSVRLVLLVGLAGALLLAFSTRETLAPPDAVGAPVDDVLTDDRVHDALALVTRVESRYNEYLRAIETETGVDIRLHFTTLPNSTTLEQFAAAEATRIGIGRHSGGLHGVLVVYDATSQRLRVEVGYGLEEHFTDAFVGYLIEQHTESFFRAGNPELGIRLMIRILHGRIRDHMMGGRFDPTPFLRRDDAAFVSGGAGASGVALLGADPEMVRSGLGRFREPFDPGEKQQFRAQPTPEAAYDRYLEWLAQRRFDPNVELFTPASRSYLNGLPITPAYFDYMLNLYYGHSYRIVERGDIALLYFTGTPLASPLFFRRSDAGWQSDTMLELQNTREYVGGWGAWGLVQGSETFSRFADLFTNYDGRGPWRVIDGDNRPLPTPAVQRGRRGGSPSRR